MKIWVRVGSFYYLSEDKIGAIVESALGIVLGREIAVKCVEKESWSSESVFVYVDTGSCDDDIDAFASALRGLGVDVIVYED